MDELLRSLIDQWKAKLPHCTCYVCSKANADALLPLLNAAQHLALMDVVMEIDAAAEKRFPHARAGHYAARDIVLGRLKEPEDVQLVQGSGSEPGRRRRGYRGAPSAGEPGDTSRVRGRKGSARRSGLPGRRATDSDA